MKSKNSDMPINGWWDILPASTHKWVRLGRFDRPIGSWLLLLPCLWTLPLSSLKMLEVLYLFCIFFIGSFIMRAAGCVINDLWDKNIDKKISRTMNRPIASGEISVINAIIFLTILLFFGLICLLSLNKATWIIALLSVPIIIIYPLAKRFTKWPQVVLGIAFSWGVPTAWVASGGSWDLGIFFIYIGTIFWVIGYDTIYGCQDRYEDKLFGVNNTAVTTEKYLVNFVKITYFISTIFFLFAGIYLKLHIGWFMGLLFMSAHLFLQSLKLKKINRNLSLKIFQSNKIAGSFLVIGSISKFL
jgi:4-hydroxybenzoate polyprenyltransferase|tara:strand:+ start:753 stop:1655 length:903 start_codon:yes stop_codon:yes gene_type:complete